MATNPGAATGVPPAPTLPQSPLPIAPEGASDLVREVFERYPSYAYLLSDPEVGPLLLQAVDPNGGFDPETFAARLQATNWYRTTAPITRTWDARRQQDPAATNAEIQARMYEIDDFVKQSGFTLSFQQVANLAEQTLRFGIAVGSSQFRDSLSLLVPEYREGPTGTSIVNVGGTFGQTYSQIRQMAADYLVPLSDRDAWNMARQVFAGDLDPQGIAATFAGQASARFGGSVADAIDRGLTPGQFFAPTRAAIASELDMNAEQIDLMDPRWSSILGVDDGKGGTRPMTLTEAQRYARSQPEWQRTQRANDEASALARSLVESFGRADF